MTEQRVFGSQLRVTAEEYGQLAIADMIQYMTPRSGWVLTPYLCGIEINIVDGVRYGLEEEKEPIDLKWIAIRAMCERHTRPSVGRMD